MNNIVIEHPKTKRRYREMYAAAENVKKHLTEVCERIEIAGSIRRQMQECGDIEIVCIPKFKMMPDQSALFAMEKKINLLEEKLKNGTFKAILKNGDRYKQFVLNDGIYLDIFITNAIDWGRQLAIRTGPSNYSKMLASIWKQKGWCGTEDGLRRIDQSKKIGEKWLCTIKDAKLPPRFKTEKDFFEFLGLAMIDPRFRKDTYKKTF